MVASKVVGVIPVGVVGERFGTGLLAVGELWFLLDIEYDTGMDAWNRGWLWLFDGVGVVRHCWHNNNIQNHVGPIASVPVEELEAFRVAVGRYLEDAGSGG